MMHVWYSTCITFEQRRQSYGKSQIFHLTHQLPWYLIAISLSPSPYAQKIFWRCQTFRLHKFVLLLPQTRVVVAFFFYMQHYLHISSLTVCLSVGKCTLLADVFFCPMALEEKRKHLRQATDIEKIALTCRQYKIVWIPNIVKKVFSDLGFGLCNYMCSIVCILTFLVHFCLLLFFFSSNQRDLTIVLFLACFSIIRIANAFNSYSIALCSVCKQLFEKQRKVVSFWTVTFAFTSPI